MRRIRGLGPTIIWYTKIPKNSSIVKTFHFSIRMAWLAEIMDPRLPPTEIEKSHRNSPLIEGQMRENRGQISEFRAEIAQNEPI